jgi:predicted metal-dependent peptidase
MSAFEVVELDAKQKQQWGDTMSLMAWTCPGFRHIFYKLLVNNDGVYGAVFTKSVPIAATDAKNILINPDTFFAIDLKQRVFIVAHEIVHNIYGDVEQMHRFQAKGKVPLNNGKELPFDNDQFQWAMDYRINALLVDSKVGEMPKNPDGTQAGLYDPKIAGANDSVLDVYQKIYKKRPDNKGKGGFDIILQPGASTGQNPGAAANQRNQQQWAVEISAARTIEQMRSQGKMAGSMQRMFKEILEPEVPWTEHIQGIFNRRIGSGSYNWRRPDRRFLMQDLHMPSRSGHGAGWLVIWGDTSGSIGASELHRYLAELTDIVESVRPRRLTVLWCDARIHRIDEVEEACDLQKIRYEGVGGGGGTSVDPVFKWIADSQEVPDMLLCFTDGYVTIPNEPAFPVLWASTTDKKYPYGEVVRING